MTPRKLHCPACGTFIGRDPWPIEPVRVIRHDCDAGPWRPVRICRQCGPVECRIAPGVLRVLRLAMRGLVA